jgi:O-antigen/teichoic acid export membrane protein
MSLKRNVVANYVGQGWAALMGIAFVPLYVKVLGIESYGLVGVFAVLQAWMTLLDLGLTPTLSREMARLRAGAHTAESIRDLLRSLELIYALLAVLMVAAVWFGAQAVVQGWLKAGNLSQSVMIDSIRIMGFVLAARWLEQVYRGALLGMQDQVWLNVAQAGLATLRWAGAYLIVAYVSPTILAFFAWQGAVSCFTSASLIHRTYAMLPRAGRSGKFNVSALREVKSFATGMFLSAALTFALTQADKIVISKMLSLEQLGFYMLAGTAAGGLMQLIVPMNNAIYPRLTEQVTKDDHEAVARTYHQACEWMAAIIIPPALLLIFFAHPVLLLWTGDEHLSQSVQSLLVLLTLGTLCNGLMNLPYMLQLAHGWTSLTVRTNLVAVLLVVPAIVWAVPRYGAVGAAGAWFALNLGYLVVGAHLMHRRLLPQSKWRWYRQAVAMPLSAGCLAGAMLVFVLPSASTRGAAALSVTVAILGLFVAVIAALPSVRHVAFRLSS